MAEMLQNSYIFDVRRLSDMPDNADAGYVILMSLVSDGVAMFVLLDDGVLHVVCLHCSGWEYRGFPMLKVPPPPHAI